MANTKQSLSQSFLENVEQMAETELLNAICDASMTIKSVNADKAGDDKLSAAREIVKDLAGAYNECIKYEKTKIKHMLERLEFIRAKNDLRQQGINV
jgi:hypothetical protein